MLAQIDELKNALGIDPAEVNLPRDRLLESSLRMANGLIAGYIGFDVSQVDEERIFTSTIDNTANYIKLPVFPVIEVVSITNDGTALSLNDYRLDSKNGLLDGIHGWVRAYASARYGHRVTVVFRAGFETIPEDLVMVCVNLASTIYNLGGSLNSTAVSGSGGSGALKSLTMFDAMSMSFDTGSTAAVDNSPEGLLATWSFILKQYRTNSPVMA